ncbi:hypothetical protein MTR67_014689 [Solanum verrucosum]|uniref:Uncharacterized protein n=1 Tax=Solanum verrucosum TaxID=315347 RepID=A0AAF0QK08_SOLVR|nr:hypothetical protein MTR67_014689 [Solanum verrucosum]
MSDFSCLESVLGHVDAINAVVVSQNGVVYTASADGEIKVWRREKNKHSLVTTLRKHKSSVNAMSLNNDGTILFSGGCDEKIVVWEKEEHCVDYMLATCLLKGHNVLEGHCKPVKSVTAAWDDEDENGNNNNNDGILSVFSGSLDGEIRVWQDLVHEIFKLVWKRKAAERGKNELSENIENEVGASSSKRIRPTFGKNSANTFVFSSTNANALKLSSELLRVFVAEAIQRAATIAEAEGSVKIEATHLERILPQLLLDF